jgi:hypothetical protein
MSTPVVQILRATNMNWKSLMNIFGGDVSIERPAVRRLGRRQTMRFMMLMYPSARAEAGEMPTADDVAAMMKYNEELARAGVLLALDGLHPSSKGARVTYAGGKPKVTDGPFADSKEVLGGYWLIQVKSREEAIEWAKRVPAGDAKFVEVRQVFEVTDFPADVQKAADSSTVAKHLEQRQRQ